MPEEKELGTRHKGLLRELGQRPAECHKGRKNKGPVAHETIGDWPKMKTGNWEISIFVITPMFSKNPEAA